MESIGQKLVSARESLGFSVEQIARETNIAKSYLTALEVEDFESFPGETYIIGFLRNYSEFLGLDPEEMVNLYRNMKIQEQPAPIEELLDSRGSVPRSVLIVIIIAAVLGLGAAGYFYFYPKLSGAQAAGAAVVSKEPEQEEAVKDSKINIRETYEFSDEVLEKRFNKYDAISVLLDNSRYQLVITDIADNVTFSHPQGDLVMENGGEALLDLDGDNSADIRMLLRSSDADKESLVLHVDRFVQSAESDGEDTLSTSASASEVSFSGTTASESIPVGNAGAPSRVVDPVVIRSASTAEPFNLNIIFRGYCLLRYEADSVREERYFHKGETFRIDVNTEVTLWASNAGALTAKVNGVDVNLGSSGEISTRNIKWLYNSADSNYELQLIPVY